MKQTVIKPIPEEIIVLQNGDCIPKALHDSLMSQIKIRLPVLTHGVDYTVENLCGKDFWSLLKRGERILAGKFVVYQVENGYLELITVKWEHEYPKKYKLK